MNDWLVTGGGATALFTALLASRRGNNVVLLSPPAASRGRHYALSEKSHQLLSTLGAMAKTIPVRRFVLDNGGRKKTLDAHEAGLDALCRIVAEEDLLSLLRRRVRQSKVRQVSLSADDMIACDGDDHSRRITLRCGDVFAGRLLAAADGANSAVAALLNIAAVHRPFYQQALVMLLNASLPLDTAFQFFRPWSTLALLPAGAGVFSLIWSLPSEQAAALLRQGEEAIALRAAARAKLPPMTAAGAAACFPLFALRRAVRATHRAAFIGDSARVIHPLAGQGLNLGIADADCLLQSARECGEDWRRGLQKYTARSARHAAMFHGLTDRFAAQKPPARTMLAMLEFSAARKLAIHAANH